MTVAEIENDVLSERARARGQLADAIAGVDTARARLEEAKAAVEGGWDRMIAAGNRLEALKAELPQLANSPPAEAVLAALATGSAAETRSPRALAEDEIRVLEESREQLRRAIETGEQEVARRKSAIGTAEAHVKRMAAAVLQSSGATERLLHGLLDLERQVVERRLGLAFLLRHGAVPVADKAAVERLLDGYALPTRAAASDHSDWGRHMTTTAWAAALKELERDPDARLPVD